MLRRIVLFLAVFSVFACSVFAAPCAFAEAEEQDVDIAELIKIVEEEKVKEKKDSDGAYLLTVTCTGDFTIGGDNRYGSKKDLFTPELEAHDGDINFIMQNVRNIFTDDDLTIVNFEGTLTDTKYVPKDKKENEFLFNITPSAVSVLPDNGVEAVSLDNNHVWDHGLEGYNDTKMALENAGVIYSTPSEIGVFDYKGILKIAMLSFNCIDRYGTGFKKYSEGNGKHEETYPADFLSYDTFEEAVCASISEAKASFPLVIVSFHWGREPTKANPIQGYIPTDNQIRLGRMAVDAGADLVIGNHSHRLQPVEFYKDKFICYSLGNFCFAGHKKPDDMTSMLFQVRYRVKNGEISYKDFRIIPIRISSITERNNLIPYPFEDGYTRDSILNVIKENINRNKLQYAVTDFPLEFQ